MGYRSDCVPMEFGLAHVCCKEERTMKKQKWFYMYMWYDNKWVSVGWLNQKEACDQAIFFAENENLAFMPKWWTVYDESSKIIGKRALNNHDTRAAICMGA